MHAGGESPRSAFAAPGVLGRVFVEAWQWSDVAAVCRGMGGVRWWETRAVTFLDGMSLLNVRRPPFSPQVGDWVRLKVSPYTNDLGFVRQLGPGYGEFDVVLIPRLRYESSASVDKRKRGGHRSRQPPALFDRHKAVAVSGTASVEVVAKPLVHYLYSPDHFVHNGRPSNPSDVPSRASEPSERNLHPPVSSPNSPNSPQSPNFHGSPVPANCNDPPGDSANEAHLSERPNPVNPPDMPKSTPQSKPVKKAPKKDVSPYLSEKLRDPRTVFTFDSAGFLLLSVRSSDYHHISIHPTVKEIQPFLRSPAIPTTAKLHSFRLASGWELQEGDQVKVVGTQYSGLLGRVKGFSQVDAFVFLFDLPGNVQIPLSCLRRHYKAGDRARVILGVHTGFVGYVTLVDDAKGIVMMTDGIYDEHKRTVCFFDLF